MKTNKLIFLLKAILAVVLSTTTLQAQKIALSGTIVSESGTPVAGASLTVFNETRTQALITVSTNAQGQFNTGALFLSKQRIEVEITADGFEKKYKSYTINTGKTGNIKLIAAVSVTRSGAAGNASPKMLSITGTIKSDQVTYLKDVIVSYSIPGETGAIENDITNEKGKYQSKGLFKKGDIILVTAHKDGFSELSKTIIFDNGKNQVVDFILSTRTFIAGFVVDARTSQAVANVQISYQSKGGPFVEVIKTNSRGYFDIDIPAPFVPGDKITLRAENKEFAPEDRVHVITVAENRCNFVLQKWVDKGVDLEIRVLNRKGKPLKNVEISYFDIAQDTVFSQENGKAALNVKKSPGDPIQFQLLKHGYRLETRDHTLRKEFQSIEISLGKDGSVCPCWSYTAAGLGVASGSAYLLYNTEYKDYKDLKNLNREEHYKKADTWLKTGTIAGGLAIGALTGWLICNHRESKRIKAEEQRRRRIGMVPLPLLDGTLAGGVQFGARFLFTF